MGQEGRGRERIDAGWARRGCDSQAGEEQGKAKGATNPGQRTEVVGRLGGWGWWGAQAGAGRPGCHLVLELLPAAHIY